MEDGSVFGRTFAIQGAIGPRPRRIVVARGKPPIVGCADAEASKRPTDGRCRAACARCRSAGRVQVLRRGSLDSLRALRRVGLRRARLRIDLDALPEALPWP